MDYPPFLLDISFSPGCAIFVTENSSRYLQQPEIILCDSPFKTAPRPCHHIYTFFVVSTKKSPDVGPYLPEISIASRLLTVDPRSKKFMKFFKTMIAKIDHIRFRNGIYRCCQEPFWKSNHS